MYLRTFRKANHERRFCILDAGSTGWEVSDERDREVVRRVLYDDWHRVERARLAFVAEGARLREAGWTEL